MKNIVLFLTISLSFACSIPQYKGDASPISHSLWDSLLMEHVQSDGWVNYEGFRKDSVRLNGYLELLSMHHPNKHWTDKEQLAYWINAYNAFTIKLVTDNYPVNSIKDIKPGVSFVNSVWDIKFINIESRTYDLNNIEHGIIRKHFSEPRIHFAVNCASISCPRLQPWAYTADKLDNQLTAAAKEFLSDTSRNILSPDKIQISSIFKWFRGDFTKNGTLIQFLNQYSPVKIRPEAAVEHLPYDWGINDAKKQR